jgi:hypothetical protein
MEVASVQPLFVSFDSFSPLTAHPLFISLSIEPGGFGQRPCVQLVLVSAAQLGHTT